MPLTNETKLPKGWVDRPDLDGATLEIEIGITVSVRAWGEPGEFITRFGDVVVSFLPADSLADACRQAMPVVMAYLRSLPVKMAERCGLEVES